MKLLNELISLRRLDDEPELDQADQHEELEPEMDAVDSHDDVEGMDDMSDDMGTLDDKQGGDDYQDVSPENPYDEGSPEHEAWVAGYEAASQEGGEQVDDEMMGDDTEVVGDEMSDEVSAEELPDDEKLPVEDEEQTGMKEECPSCNGTGVDYGETCVRCGGKGYLVSGQYDDDEPQDMTDVEADADTLRSVGWGTDEDYGDYGHSEDEEDNVDFYTDKNWRDRYGQHVEPEDTRAFSNIALTKGENAFLRGKTEQDNPYEEGTLEHNEWLEGFLCAHEEAENEARMPQRSHDEENCEMTFSQYLGSENEEQRPTRASRAAANLAAGNHPSLYRYAIKDLTNGKYIMTVRTDERTMDLKVWFTKNPANAGKFKQDSERLIKHIRTEIPALAKHDFKIVRIQREPVVAREIEDEEMGRADQGAYDQQGSHMGGAKDTDTMDTDVDPDAANELDLGDELGDNEEGKEKVDPKLDALTDKQTQDPDRQGVVRTVKSAHLVYKRQIEDGTYEELWIYNVGNMRDELDVRKAILAGTDIPTTKTMSPDGSQKYEIWSSGNAEMLQIKGLPN